MVLAGNPDGPHDLVWADNHAVAVLARCNTLIGHTPAAPRIHCEQVLRRQANSRQGHAAAEATWGSGKQRGVGVGGDGGVSGCRRSARLGSNVRPWEYREESTMSNEQAAPVTKGVAVELLATVGLGPEIEAWQGANFECVW